MRNSISTRLIAIAAVFAVGACTGDGPTTPLDQEPTPTPRLAAADWSPGPLQGESGVYVCKISAESFERASDPTYDPAQDPAVGTVFEFSTSVDGAPGTLATAPGQTWVGRSSANCALVYDGVAGVGLAITEVALPGSSLISVFGEFGSFDSGFSDVGSVDLAARTITLTVQSGATIIYFKNAYEEQPGGDFEGCTPGYWRQSQHFGNWTGYAPEDSFDAVFGVSYGGTLLEAVWARGGGANALARHAVAALLNTANSDVTYSYSEADVIAGVQAAFASGDYESAKNRLASANEIGCDLGRAELEGAETTNDRGKEKSKKGR